MIAEGITSAKNLANFRFFTNQFDTRTQGVDLVASFVPPGMGGDTEFSLAINHTATTVTSYNPAVLDEIRIRQLEDALPGTRWTTSGRRDMERICRCWAGSATTRAGSIRVTTGTIRANSSWTWRPPTR